MKLCLHQAAVAAALALAFALPAGAESSTKSSGLDFDSADKNKDGQLSRSEFQSLRKGILARPAVSYEDWKTRQNLAAGKLKGVEVLNQTGTKIGDIDRLVADRDSDKLYAVVSVGGFLGLGDTEITLPLNSFGWKGDQLVAPLQASKSQLKEREERPQIVYKEVPDDRPIGLVSKSAAAAAAKPATFRAVDTNNNGSIDRAEFSAFEADMTDSAGSGGKAGAKPGGAKSGDGY